ncbi:hypothetical protein CERZMDRAFT_102621 [Cercospora zeae-maydis SCOH1-5]|uniref:Uncharacterized protein n=1 Tax=Cercospora zeae-maydis SCOH1-5 TaxID=717836 RepID=A0A6A6F1D1_9PEZI|nr:hypothetical protein CERZMDRAFT_102621 [Cercospora zeae-maydis SCOH1-5]
MSEKSSSREHLEPEVVGCEQSHAAPKDLYATANGHKCTMQMAQWPSSGSIDPRDQEQDRKSVKRSAASSGILSYLPAGLQVHLSHNRSWIGAGHPAATHCARSTVGTEQQNSATKAVKHYETPTSPV